MLVVAMLMGAALADAPAARGQDPDASAPAALYAPEDAAGAAPTGAPGPAGGLAADGARARHGQPPFTPQIVSVTADPRTPLTRFYTLVEPFSDPDGPGEAAATDWRIVATPLPNDAGDAIRTVYRSAAGAPPGAAPDLFLLPPGVLERGGHYAVQMRYEDREGNWSPWSLPAPLLLPPPPAVAPAVPDPPPGLIRFKADPGTIRPMGELTGDDLDPAHRPDGIFLYGLAALCITDLAPGATASVLYMLPARPPDGFRWVHHHPGSGLTDRTDRTHVNLDTITESLTDGGDGDADGVENGVILATVGLLVPRVPRVSETPGTPGLSE